MEHELLQELWFSWGERGAVLTRAQWATPTRLPGWTVRELFAHTAPTPSYLIPSRTAVVDRPAAFSSGAEILRFFNRPGGLAHTGADVIAEDARDAAAGLETAVLVRRFAEDGPAGWALLRELPPEAVLERPYLGTATLGAMYEIAVMEATVHLLDLVAAVGGPPPPAAALRLTGEILVAVADPVEFIEAATGRTERSVLPVMR
ncbi:MULTISPECIES: maleylpyruvate isomerase N-terminal domain-containing protein [unclassified Nocardia]|uniref:maleylpyruvate isomerase N-terminal domain-containing protein n=1 Tax=unclassified Nocardia TaxID=2637762 RepID=UPI001CE407DE|nr:MULTISPECIES: maleylpyruvate isomerase N-terminal domain-containing protein [unclassified Nocardia]